MISQRKEREGGEEEETRKEGEIRQSGKRRLFFFERGNKENKEIGIEFGTPRKEEAAIDYKNKHPLCLGAGRGSWNWLQASGHTCQHSSSSCLK